MEIWEEISADRQAGAKRLVAEYGDRLFTAACRIVQSEADADDLVFERHGGVDVRNALESGDQHALVLARGKELLLLAAEKNAPAAPEHRGAVKPDLDLHLAAHAVGVDDLSRVDIGLLFHELFPLPQITVYFTMFSAACQEPSGIA